MTYLVLLVIEPLFDLFQLKLLLTIRKVTDFRVWLKCFEVHYEILEFIIEFFSILEDLIAPLNKFITIKILRKLPCYLLLIFIFFLTNEYNILQLVDVFVKLFELNNFVIEALLELVLHFFNLLFHFLLIVFHMYDFTENLILLLLIDLLQLLQTEAHRCEASFHFKKLLGVREGDLASRLDLFLELIEFFKTNILG